MNFSKFILLFIVNFLLNSNVNNADQSGDGKPFGSIGPFLKIDELSSISTNSFLNDYVIEKKPLLLKGAAKNFPATKLWDDAYLYKKAESFKDNLFDIETVKKETRSQNYVQMTFRDFLDKYRTKDLYMVSDINDHLKSEVILPQPLQCEHAHRLIDKMIMWFSSGNTKSVLHTDDYENILCVIDGVKNLKLVDPSAYPEESEVMIDQEEGSYSSMDVDKVDFKKFPGIEKVKYYDVTLQKGDCMYIPLKWLHQVRSFKRNIGLNFWFNYEKSFTLPNFSEECDKNVFDKTKTLDTFNLENEDGDEEKEPDNFLQFKYWLIRKVSDQNRKLQDWIEILVEEILPKEKTIEDFPSLKSLILEFYDILDYDGNGEISDQELKQLDMNQLEHLANLIEAIDEEIVKLNIQPPRDNHGEREEL